MNYDYIVIGSGAGGSAAAYRLAKAGKNVLLLEKGKALPRDGSTLDCDKVIGQGLFKNKEPWLDRRGSRLLPEEYFNVGGKTKWYGAALLRFAAHEFQAEPDFQCPGWPLGYDDIAPYYREAERLLGVRHFPIEPNLAELRDRIQQSDNGWYSAPLPLALHEDIVQQPHEAAHFDGFASVLGLKADGQSLLDRLGPNNGLRLLSGQPVRTLFGDSTKPQRILGVELENGDRFTAKQVLLAAGALHSPRILQGYLQTSGMAAALPSADLIGRYFKRHLLTAMLAFSKGRKTDVLRKTTAWFHEDFAHSSVQPLGFGSDVLASLIPSLIPRQVAKYCCDRAYGFFLQTEDGSRAENRVVAATGSKGLPMLDYDSARLPAAQQEHEAMVQSFRRTLREAGCFSLVKPIPLAGTAHACGTLIAGDDPAHSVVDLYGKVHGFANLSVVDGSVLPRSSRVNPALTIYAWALRSADHLLEGAQSNV
ncbi:MAG: FAD-dependent oxidoreductase [Gammaproteobacteria bacterium]